MVGRVSPGAKKPKAKESRPTIASTETRVIKPHPKLLMDVIKRQAGTLAKAILEGVMNSIDAEANCIEITIKSKQVRLVDNGRGITDRSSIENFFETFGYPHDESEGKVYGQFRMGRGQMFAFGKNTWRTGSFQMIVDVDNNGLDYELNSNMKSVDGCEILIELYQEMSHVDEAKLRQSLQQLCRYAPIAVIVDGEQIQINPDDEKWTEITDEAYIRIAQSGTLDTYNLGIHTLSQNTWTHGVAGVIVSKKQLKVNFARNDIMSDCPVWQAITKSLKKHIKKESDKARKRGLTEAQCQWVLNDLMTARAAKQWNPTDSPLMRDFHKHKMFYLASGSRRSIQELVSKHMEKPWTSADHGDRSADYVTQMRLATVFSNSMMSSLKLTTTEALARFIGDVVELAYKFEPDEALQDDYTYIYRDWKNAVQYLEHKTLPEVLENYDESLTIIQPEEMDDKQKIWMRILHFLVTGAQKGIQARGHELGELWDTGDLYKAMNRKLYLGHSNYNLAWTDGENYVVFDWKRLRKRACTLMGLGDIADTLMHEWCHTTADHSTHEHGVDFYKLFHDRAALKYYMVNWAMRQLLNTDIKKELSVKQIEQLSLR